MVNSMVTNDSCEVKVFRGIEVLGCHVETGGILRLRKGVMTWGRNRGGRIGGEETDAPGFGVGEDSRDAWRIHE